MKFYRFCAVSLWAALPATALGYWWVWDQLPMRLAVRFNHYNLQCPVAYIARDRLLMMELAATATVISIASAIPMLVPRERRPDVVSWIGLGFFYGIVGMLLSCQCTLLHFELSGLPMSERSSIAFIDPTVISTLSVGWACFIGWKLWNWMLCQT